MNKKTVRRRQRAVAAGCEPFSRAFTGQSRRYPDESFPVPKKGRIRDFEVAEQVGVS
jgi:hypothetical protein